MTINIEQGFRWNIDYVLKCALMMSTTAFDGFVTETTWANDKDSAYAHFLYCLN